MLLVMHGINLLGGKVLIVPIIVLSGLALLLIGGTAILRRKQVHHDASAPGLFGVTGRMGGGKSYFLSWMAYVAIKRGRLVFCTYELAGFKTFEKWREDFDNKVLWIGPVLIEASDGDDDKGWHQIIQVPEGSMVIVDEAHGWWPSSAWNAPIEVRMWISTIRHRRITFFWATQWVDAVAKWLRALSFGIWECENFKAGHRYTLYHPRKINGKIGTREYDARIFVKRTPEVMAMYDTHNTASFSEQWGGGDTVRKSSQPVLTTAPYVSDGQHRSPF